ncbi:uncharacterized protein [Montipora capricornis]|uniref:uncharacterized protein n=1 Tax=Montipora capricornis TaxID=246305 RepID=UPI0035F1A71A
MSLVGIYAFRAALSRVKGKRISKVYLYINYPFFSVVMVAKTQTSQSLSSMSSSSVTPRTLSSSSSSSAMSLSSATPRTLASSSSSSSPSTLPVTPATKPPGWLSGGHPSVEDGAVVRRVCFGRGCTCDTFVYISVRNCSGFYVYNLTSIPSSNCYYGYCASTGFEEPTSSATEKEMEQTRVTAGHIELVQGSKYTTNVKLMLWMCARDKRRSNMLKSIFFPLGNSCFC